MVPWVWNGLEWFGVWTMFHLVELFADPRWMSMWWSPWLWRQEGWAMLSWSIQKGWIVKSLFLTPGGKAFFISTAAFGVPGHSSRACEICTAVCWQTRRIWTSTPCLEDVEGSCLWSFDKTQVEVWCCEMLWRYCRVAVKPRWLMAYWVCIIKYYSQYRWLWSIIYIMY